MAVSSGQSLARNVVESGQRAAARSDTSAGTEARTATFRVWRGAGTTGKLEDYATEVSEGMVVLDAIHRIQAEGATDMAVRWNCKAGKCGSCSAEINGIPANVHDAAQRARSRQAGDGRADARVPADQGSGHRCVVQLPGEEANQKIHPAAS